MDKVYVEMTSADIADSLRIISENGITLFNIEYCGEFTIRCSIRSSDLSKLEALCNKRGDGFAVKHKKGFSWLLQSFLRRPVLLTGMCILIITASLISSRILFIRVEGNVTVADRKILEAAEMAGVCFGTPRREIRSERVKNYLLEALPELKWACVNTYGCVAKISVRERSIQEEQRESLRFGNIVADRDGVVLNCTATKGSLLCKEGQAVKKGEILISGYTDCGIFIQTSGAEGEVYAQTLRHMEAITPEEYLKKTVERGENKKYSLIIGKKRINLWQSSGISDTLCDRMYEEYYAALPGGFQLPVTLCVEYYIDWTSEPVKHTKDDAVNLLDYFVTDYLADQMIAGNVQNSKTETDYENSCFRIAGSFVCVEMIGRFKQEQIGEYNGESD